MKNSTRPWYSAAAAAAAVAVAALVLSFSASPGVAADTNGKPAGTLTVSPATGSWEDAANGVSFTTTSTLTCPASTVKREGKTVTAQIVHFIASPGKESPQLSGPTEELGGLRQFIHFKENYSAFSGDVATNPDGSVPDRDGSVFPGYANDDDQTWRNTADGGSIYDFASIFKPNSTYSLVQACVYFVPDIPHNTYQYFYEPDPTGHLRAAWSTLTTDAANKWTVKPVEVPTDKPTSDKPTSDKPTSDKPTSDEPTSEKPASEKPVTENPTSGPPLVLPENPSASSTVPAAVGAIGSNDPFNPLTNWVSSTASSPAGIGMLFMFLVLLSVPLLLGWRLLIRRSQRRH